MLLLAGAHVLGFVFQHFRLPRVIGEIAGGFIFGPTLLGLIRPDIYQNLFAAFPSEGALISGLYWAGLVLLMFISGFEIKRTVGRQDLKLILAILVGGTLLPFYFGLFGLPFFNFTDLVGQAGNILALKIIVGIAIAVTSIPVISKIFIDLGLAHTRFAKVVIASATIEDVLLWTALSVATSLVTGNELSGAGLVGKVFVTILFFGLGLWLIPKLLTLVNHSRYNFIFKSSTIGYSLTICFLLVALADLLEVNLVFGALLAGIIIGSQTDPRIESARHLIKEVALASFVPLYFAIVGLKLDLVHHFSLSLFLVFLIFATLIKITGTMLGARLAGQSFLPSLNLGLAMNARGGPGIVLATITFEAGIINEFFFTTLILTAIVTSLVAGRWLGLVNEHKWPLLDAQ
ncbi:MAG: cation:proton antiporter [Patescibacteria group bacterium]